MDTAIKILLIFALVELVMILFYAIKPGLPRLPGDIFFDKSGINVYIPFASSLVITIILSILFSLIGFRLPS